MRRYEVAVNSRQDVSLTVYLQDVEKEFRNITKRPAVLIIPGGGYQFCSDREADPVAFAYLKAGYDAFVLRYSVGDTHKWPEPLNDYEDAMEYIENHAEEWNVLADKIAVVGFSAGGHLAGAAATIAKHKPAAAVLGYAVLNEVVDEIAQDAPRIAEQVNYDTVPCFLFASRSDNVVPIKIHWICQWHWNRKALHLRVIFMRLDHMDFLWGILQSRQEKVHFVRGFQTGYKTVLDF